MKQTSDELRERLLALDSVVAPADYAMQLQQLIEHKLPPHQRGSFFVGGLVSLGFGAWFTWLAIEQAHSLPILARAGFIFGAVIAFLSGIIALQIVRTGVFNARRHNTLLLQLWAASAMGAGILLIVLGLGHDELGVSVRMGFAGILSFLSGGGFMFRQIMDQMALNQREQLLEIQYQLSGVMVSQGETAAKS